MGFSIQHLLLTLAIVVLIFGTKRLKNVGSDVGDAIKGFRKAMQDGKEDPKLVEGEHSVLSSNPIDAAKRADLSPDV
jgi:sec-independent protein translocase protein TatA